MMTGARWRVLAWVAVVIAAGAAVGLGVDTAVAGPDKAAGLAGVIAGFCELVAFVIGVSAWAAKRRAALSGQDTRGATSVDTAAIRPSQPMAGNSGERGKYVVDARRAKGMQIGEGNIQYSDFRGPSPDEGTAESHVGDQGLPAAHTQQNVDARSVVDARDAKAIQVGEGNTLIIYSYAGSTWTDGVAAPPLVDVAGQIDSPYRGLNAFEQRDAALFFGREAAATRILERMSEQLNTMGLLVVSGVSGVGKSSLLRAGVLPRMQGAGLASAPGSALWPCLVFTPAHAPLDELAVRVAALAGADAAAVRDGLEADAGRLALTVRQAALAQGGGSADDPGRLAPEPRLLLVVDQFEQLFTQCPDEAERRAFITALHAAATTRHGPDRKAAALVVLVVRADFEARCADYPHLAEAVQSRYLVTSMSERQLRMAITEPAKKARSKIEDDLVEVLLREVGDRTAHASSVSALLGQASRAGALPLLSHALDQAWRQRSGSTVTLADYERTGGIEGAVADSAQRAYGRLTPAQQDAARQVFVRLTAAGPDSMDVADRASQAELVEGKSEPEIQDVTAVLQEFAAERLLTLAAGTVEISHEILLTAWPLLRDNWLAETHEDRIVRTRLRNTAIEWVHHSRDRSYLYNGSVLESATAVTDRIAADPARNPPLSQYERDFLLASTRASRRAGVIRRFAVGGLVVLLAAAVTAAAVAAAQAGTARRQRNLATRQRDLAVSAVLAAQGQALIGADPLLSRLLSLAAWQIAPTAQARYSMVNAAAQRLIAYLFASSGAVSSVAFSPAGHTIATAGTDGSIRLWNTVNHSPLGPPLVTNAGSKPLVAFSPDGRILATSSSNGDGEPTKVRMWDAATRRQLGPPLPGNHLLLVGFGSGSNTVVTSSSDGTVQMWNVATHHRVGTPLATHSPAGLFCMAISPNGRFLAAAGHFGTVSLWDVVSHRYLGSPVLGSGDVTSMVFSPDGRVLAVGGLHRVWLWDMASHRHLGSPLVASGDVTSVAFTPDDRTLAAGSGEGTVQLWDVATHRSVGNSLVATSYVSSLAFSPNGRTLAAGSNDGRVRLWDMATQRQLGPPLISNGVFVNAVAFSPDGRVLAAGLDCGLQLWSLAARRPIRVPRPAACPHHPAPHSRDGVESLAFTPHGRTLATAGDDGAIRLWNAATGQQVGAPMTTIPRRINSVAFSPDGRTLAFGASGTLQLWDVTTHRKTALGSRGIIKSLAFSPDGRTLAVGGYALDGSATGSVQLWNMVALRKIGILSAANAQMVNSVAFSPDGHLLATGGGGNAVRLWDVATQRTVGAPLTSNISQVDAIAFSPNGQTLATVGGGKVQLWDVDTRRVFGVPLTNGGRARILSVAFSPDGRTIATGGSFSGQTRLWGVAYLADTASSICTNAGRSLTRTEWQKYAPGVPYRKLCPAN